MPGFSDEERERIREQLIESGRERLLTYGPKKTTVKDVTDPVGIAKPTFYQFFDAKSDLYIEILRRELEEYLQNVRAELAGVDDPQEALERLFRCYAEFVEGNPLIQQTVVQGNYQEIVGSGSKERYDELVEAEMAQSIPIIEDIQRRSDGPLAEMEPTTVLGLMGSSVALLALHQDELERYEGQIAGLEHGYYDRMQDVLISTLARGLTTEG
ncbi:TetR/AcrR family transcriptional regulator [Halococcus hamelinensis]|uniref:Transcriptional regulator n=1 Tax=Halococcus hamelinensis 100A6 TaxID=1132509 RepID=M0M0N9_9EURY|nr:TetR family transcriptional regulator [Halococcus hamelinensis]EMA38184.1 transcriptional regulator [Halococcus hamelinensis 100A6]